ncbi:DUF1903-domain-containing protein [Scleroderma yunnanense]
MLPKPPCQAEACALQNCLTSNTYNQGRCDEFVRELYRCCYGMYKQGRNAESTVCPMQSVVERWLQKHPDVN